jgi:hypothetical protein
VFYSLALVLARNTDISSVNNILSIYFVKELQGFLLATGPTANKPSSTAKKFTRTRTSNRAILYHKYF